MITVIHGSVNTQMELKNAVYTVISEAPDVFSTLVSDAIACSAGEASGFVFIEKGKEVKISTVAEALVDYFSTEAFTKKINATLAKHFATLLSSKIIEVQNVFSEGYSVMRAIAEDFDTSIELKPDCDISAFIKMYNPSVVLDDKNLLSRLIDYINVAVEFNRMRVLIVVNLKCYLSQDDFLSLCKHCQYKGVNLICLEARETYKIPDEDVLIIDKDLCEILVLSEEI